MNCEADNVKKRATWLTWFDVFREHTALAEGKDGDNNLVSKDIPVVSLTTKCTAPRDVVSDLLSIEHSGAAKY